jgi:PilZ domain-containing protein
VIWSDHLADQRAHRRYPIGLDIQYKLLSKGTVERLGSGRTLDVSSGGACFESSDALPSKGSLELVISWPCLLEGVCPLKLIMRGRIVRSDGQRVAMQAKFHEFRTAGVRG